MWHTLQEAISLTGRSRRSLYRDMDRGLVSYRLRYDGRREIETTELIRCYGYLEGWHDVAHPKAQDMAQVGTPSLADLMAEIQTLKMQVSELKETLHRLEYKPQREPAPKATSFSDLLNQLDQLDNQP